MRLLVIRTSAMGDVALTLPALIGMRKSYPDVELLILTRSAFSPFFSGIDGVRLFHPDFKSRHKGLQGIMRLFSDIEREGRIDYVIDLHNVIRSRVLCALFSLTGVRSSVIKKGRAEKKKIISGKSREMLKHSVERYCDTFRQAGFDIQLTPGPWITPSEVSLTRISSVLNSPGTLNIGIAPYAKHELKMWPDDKMKELIGMISSKYKATFWLFGGQEEAERLDAFQLSMPGCFSVVGKLVLEEELAMISRLDLMIAMDSSNMHMAALAGTKVISLWGGTDPVSGFGAWMQPKFHSVAVSWEELECRPCTIYGKGTCRRGDLACMNRLSPDMVFSKADKILASLVNKKQ